MASKRQDEPVVLIIPSRGMEWVGVRTDLRGMRTIEGRAPGSDPVALACAHRPNVILIATDLDGDVVALVAALHACCPESSIMLLGDPLPDGALAALPPRSVRGFLTWKVVAQGVSARLVRRLLEDSLLTLDPSVHERWLAAMRGDDADLMRVMAALEHGDRMILLLLASGKRQGEIALLRHCSPSTIKVHLASLRERFGAATNEQLTYLVGRSRMLDDAEGERPA